MTKTDDNAAGTLGLREPVEPALTRFDHALRNGMDPQTAERLFGALPAPEDVPAVDPALGQKPPPRGDYLRLWRVDRSHARDTWYIIVRLPDGGEKLISTKCGAHELWEARVAYVEWLAAQNAKARMRNAPERASVLAAIDWARAWLKGRAALMKDLQANSLNSCFVNLSVAVPFFEGWRISDVGQMTSQRFMCWATKPPKEGGRKDGGLVYAHSSARAAISSVRTCLNAFLAEMRSTHRVTYPIPKPAQVFHEAYKPWEIERLGKVLAGWEWDLAAQDWKWKRDPETGEILVDPKTGERVPEMASPAEIRLREPYLRLFWMGLRLGARIEVMMHASWLDRGGPFADLKRRRFRRRGDKEKENGIKRRRACVIPRALLDMMREWRALDMRRGRGTCYIIQRQDGRRLVEPDYVRWSDLHEACGVAPRGLHALKHTCVQILKTRGVPLVLAADFLATWPHSLVNVYGADWDEAAQAVAAAALDDLSGWEEWHRDQEDVERLLGVDANSEPEMARGGRVRRQSVAPRDGAAEAA